MADQRWTGVSANGDESALEVLRDYLLRSVYVYLLTRRSEMTGRDPAEVAHLAEDCVQDALETIMAKSDQFEGRSKFTTWAYRIALNAAAARLRRRYWLDQSLDALVDSGAAAGEPATDDGNGPERSAERADMLSVIRRAIREELSDRQRRVLVGVVMDGVSPARMAEQLHTTRNNTYKLLHDARVRLRACVADAGYTSGELADLFSSGAVAPAGAAHEP